MRRLTPPRSVAPASHRQPKRPRHTLTSLRWISNSYKTIRVWCPSVTSSRTQSLWKCRISWAWPRHCRPLKPQQSTKLPPSSTQRSRVPQSTRARSRQWHSNLERISMSRIWWPRCKSTTWGMKIGRLIQNCSFLRISWLRRTSFLKICTRQHSSKCVSLCRHQAPIRTKQSLQIYRTMSCSILLAQPFRGQTAMVYSIAV